MAENTIQRIGSAEALADAKIRQAHEDAAQIIRDAQKDAQSLLSEREDAATALAEEKAADLQQANERALLAEAKKLDDELAQLATEVRERQKQAVAAVVSSIA